MKQDMNDTFRIALRAMVVAAMTLLAGSMATAQVEVHGNVYGGGNLADVKENTAVNMSDGQVYGNVFGGGKGKADNFKCDKAMVGEEKQENADADPASNDNKDKGTIVTISNGTVGTLEGEEGSKTLKAGTGNVYGGGEIGRVEWNTQVRIGVGTEGGTFAPVIYGNVFGAGKGLETHGYSALVRGNSTVTIQGKAMVGYNVYGGGEMSTVGRYWVKGIVEDPSDPAPEDLPDEMPYKQRKGGICRVTIQGDAEVGYNGAANDKGHVFGAGKGVGQETYGTYTYVEDDKSTMPKRMIDDPGEGNDDQGRPKRPAIWEPFADDPRYIWEYYSSPGDYFVFLQTLSLVTNSNVTIAESAQVKGSTYGGSESGFVQNNTNVQILGGTIGTEGSYGNVFGGGKGLETFAEAGRVKGNATVAVSNGTIQRNVYGGGELGHVGTFTETADGRFIKKKDQNGADMNTGLCTVSITDGKIGPDNNSDQEIGNVFGAGKGKDDTFKCEKAMTMETSVSIGGGTVNGNVYGGGEVGRVEYDTKVIIGRKSNETTEGSGTGTPQINGSVFGAGRGVVTHGYSALVRGNTRVDVEGAPDATVKGSVFGGGEIASVGRYGLNAENMPNILLGGGTCVVNVRGSVVITGNVFGAGQGVDPSTFNATGTDKTKLSRRMTVYTNSSEFKDDYTTETGTWELYDGSVTPNIIWEYYQNEGAYSDYLQTLALATAPNVTIDGNAQVKGSVFGGGELGLTKGSVTVTIQNGTIGTLDTSGNPVAGTGDVYGGGSLANTNTTHYVGLKNADESPIYVEEVVDGKTIKYIDTKEVHPTTIVRLTGGEVYGDAYGGGLGRLASGDVEAVEAVVVGDVLVDLNGTTNVATDEDGGRTWTANTGTVIDPVKKGCIVRRVFGCNNLNGTPQKNVTVHVYATQNANATQIANTAAVEASGDNPAVPEVTNAKVKGRYDVKDVYGGGNLAAYNPVAPNTAETSQPNTSPNGSRTQVIIDGCSLTSIQTVYGGGNAAAVPETNVDIKGAYEIGYLFGGGNGKDEIAPGVENPGADVGTLDHGTTTYGTGNANTLMEGGLIHEAYGGSNTKGVIKGSINQKSDPKSPEDEDYRCDLVVEKIVGAGKYADIDGDVNMTLSCQPSSKVPLLFAGADEANVNGNITLNITNGHFGSVFGGNNLGGAIKGKITVNVEETGCQPIKIDNLYLGSNEAAYSVFGYYESDEVHPVTGKKILKPRTAEMHAITDPEAEGYKAPVTNPATDETHTFPYAQPELNIISCTYIGNVFGGGYGEGAVMHANPTVNINMVKGDYGDTAVPAMMTELGLDNTENTEHLGIIRNVYGGGNAADIIGNPTVNIGTESQAKGAYIVGNVYGGGKGSSDTYACEKAMIGKDGDGIDNPDGGTTVRIYKGLVRGNVYGGGEIGRVEKNTAVTIGAENGTDVPVVMGDVFGAGKGLETHGYAALVRGNPTVTIQGKAKVLHSVYGGGQIASVARYQLVDGVPVALAEVKEGQYSGYCKVTVQNNAEIGPDGMKMYHTGSDGNILAGDKPDDAGHVFAAGKGVLPIVYDYAKPTSNNYHTEQYEIDDHMPKRMMLYKNKKSQYWEYADSDFDPTGVEEGDLANQDVWEYFPSEDDYFDFVKTLALATQTEVTISGNAFVKGSVYGGSENGLVQFDTDVKIQGGQIGCGKNATEPYGDRVWADDYTPSDDLECASWDYGKDTNNDGKKDQYAPYDPYAKYLNPANNKYYYDPEFTKDADGGANIATDGHTYYGNVFGGGSGSVPYLDTQQGISRYISSAGMVKGNTKVTISGGHILTNVYGGCEATNVLGSATITMTGGSVGVPRTLEQIAAHPVTCYIFGAGKGDQRIFFNKETNVDRTFVNIEGGRVYGSVFGGGEDGHVFQNTTVNIGKDNTDGPTIGTLGTSYVDGNVFGGGRGFGGDALTAGNIGGSVELNVKSGKILGSVYGGGRLASVGYGLYLEGETITEGGQTIKPYGILRPDDKYDGSYPNPSKQEASAYYDKGRGNITINISGGTIGNDNEYIYNPTAEQKAAIPNTTFDYQNHLQYTKGGNVFTGGMGRLYALDNTTLLPIWSKLGKCKGTTLNMTGGIVKSSVYGGGEIGAVAENATVNINGGTVGTKVVDPEDATKYYYFGSVFGGGKGSVDNITYPSGTADEDKIPISEAGTTGGNVEVHLNKTVASNDEAKGAVVSQVFGCNDMNGSPKGTVTVHVYATQNADKANISTKPEKNTDTYDVMAVYGGGNLAAYEPTDLTTGEAKVIIDGCGLTSIRQVYGGGNAASVPATDVLVNGTYEIEEVFGGGNGLDALPNGRPNPGANVGYKNYTIYEKDGDVWKAKDDPNYDTKEERTAEGSSIVYGTGAANVNIKGGTIHRVFGGSNTKGNVRITAVTMLEEAGGCAFCVDEAYGGGKSAPMDAEAKLLMACIPGLKEAYGGAKNAEIVGDVTLTITNGTFERIFGGNDEAGYIKGTITVNIEETGCKPIIIGELYGGGNQAPYTAPEGKQGPTLNVKSFTSIGDIFGGGLGSTAKVTGDTYVNINVSEGRWRDGTYQYATDPSVGVNDKITELNGKGYHAPEFTSGIGSIHTVFGGGNAAPVTGNTNVNVATSEYDEIVSVAAGSDVTGYYTRSGEGTEASPYTYTEATGTAGEGTTYYKKVKGADIRGNIYGGGNAAEVTGNTNVVIGKKKE